MKGVDVQTGELVDIGQAHPVADLFPMLSEDELDDLAADIKENGQIHPLILTVTGELVDGRNRLAACERLGVEPKVESFDGDPLAYILSANIARRHLNKGQTAMLVIKAYPSIAESALTKNAQEELAGQAGVSSRVLWRALVVWRWAPELVDPVIAGAVSLDEAERTARSHKAESESATATLELLRAKAPDLADKVTQEQDPLTLKEAMGAFRARQEEDEKNRKVATRLLSDSIVPLSQLKDFVEQTAGRYDQELAAPGRHVTAEAITDAIEVLRQLKAQWRKAGL